MLAEASAGGLPERTDDTGRAEGVGSARTRRTGPAARRQLATAVASMGGNQSSQFVPEVDKPGGESLAPAQREQPQPQPPPAQQQQHTQQRTA